MKRCRVTQEHHCYHHQQPNAQSATWQNYIYFRIFVYVIICSEICMSFVSYLKLTFHLLTHMVHQEYVNCVILFNGNINAHHSNWLEWNARSRSAYYYQAFSYSIWCFFFLPVVIIEHYQWLHARLPIHKRNTKCSIRSW